MEPRLPFAPVRIKIIRRPDPKCILHTEDRERNSLNQVKEQREARKLLESLQKRNQNIREYRYGNEYIKCTADAIALVANLNNVENFSLHRSVFSDACLFSQTFLPVRTFIVYLTPEVNATHISPSGHQSHSSLAIFFPLTNLSTPSIVKDKR